MSNNSAPTLYQLQSMMAAAIMRPLNEDSMEKIWLDGNTASDYAAEFIKPNKKLSSFERLEIYNKQYWYRLLESLQDDFPGVNALLGHKRFEALITAYLSQYPSQTNKLNHLGQNLPKFILQESFLTAPDTQAAYDTACLEYADIKAFDAPSKEPLKIESLKNIDTANIVFKIQSYLTVLKLNYAVDNFISELNKEHDQSTESNAISNRTIRFTKTAIPKKQRIYLAVHRFNNTVYYKRLDKDQFLLLDALMAEKTLAQACSELIAIKTNPEQQQKLATKVNKSFATWMELGWFSL